MSARTLQRKTPKGTSKHSGTVREAGTGLLALVYPYSEDVGNQICELITSGLSFEKACDQLGVRYTAAVNWRHRHPAFRERYRQAIEDRAVTHGERVLDLAEQAMGMTGDELKAQDMRIRAAQWYAERVASAMYGGKQTIDLNVGVRALTDEQLQQRLASVRAEQLALAGHSVAVMPPDSKTH